MQTKENPEYFYPGSPPEEKRPSLQCEIQHNLSALSRRSDIAGTFPAMLHPALGSSTPLVAIQDRSHVTVPTVREQRYDCTGLELRSQIKGRLRDERTEARVTLSATHKSRFNTQQLNH